MWGGQMVMVSAILETASMTRPPATREPTR